MDRDGDVDATDLWLFTGSYLSQYGEPGYNPAADFDGDGDVDSTDIWIFTGNYPYP